MKHLTLRLRSSAPLLVALLPLAFSSACFDVPTSSSPSDAPAAERRAPSSTPTPAAPAATAPAAAAPPARTSCNHALTGNPQLPASAQALELIDLGEVGFCAEDRVRVRFRSGTQQLELEAVSASPLKFVAPLWIDPRTGRADGGAVQVSVVGPQQTREFASSLRIAALQTNPDSPQLGQASLAMLEGSRSAVAEARRNLLDLAGTNNTLDAPFARSETSLDQLELAIRELLRTGSVSLRVPLVDGRELVLDRPSLAVLDALCKAFFDGGAVALSRSISSASPNGQLRQAQSVLDENWSEEMTDEITRGSLEMAQTFSGHLGVYLSVLGVIGGAAASGPLLAISGITFAVLTVAPALPAFMLNVGTRLINGTLQGHVWEAIAAPARHMFQSTLEHVVAERAAAFISPNSEAGASAVGVFDSMLGGSGGVAGAVSDWLFGPDDDELARPDDLDAPFTDPSDGFFTDGPLPADDVDPPRDDDSDPPPPPPQLEPAEEDDEDEVEEPAEPPPFDTSDCPRSMCGKNASKRRIFCMDYSTYTSFYEVDGQRIQCGDFRDSAQVIDCDERADEACAQ